MDTELQQLQTDAHEVVIALDVAAALRILRSITPRGDSGRISDALMPVYLQMLFVRLPQLLPRDFFRLIKEHVLFGLSMEGFDLGSRVYDRLSVTFEEEERVEMVREMLKSLEMGTETLGSSFEVLGKDVVPSVENWLKEYRASATASQGRTGFNEVNFLNKNASVQKLGQGQRDLLLKLLSFYDGFTNALREYDNAPELYVEDNPELELALINPSPDEWDALSVDRPARTAAPPQVPGDADDAPVEAREIASSLDGAFAADTQPSLPVEAVPIAQTPVLLSPEESTAGRKVPNVQGVLVKVPLGATERTGLEVVSDEVLPASAAATPSAIPGAHAVSEDVMAPVQTRKAPKGAPLEDLKMQAKTRQAQLQDEIEHKLADLKRKP